ncbi:aconitate hydratase [Blattabacterium cuenoti]|uniref:aconitate hydratase n=1 Tax=Blattabacterium cuenoti TaxID=1653831 RepID=UPI00163C6FBD|nr:aconitate hydratase [Blattabacterium cuenoti]
MIFDFEIIRNFYSHLKFRINKIRNIIKRPMTYSEKILYAHLFKINKNKKYYIRNEYDLNFLPDRLAMQDATAQMTLLQFMKTGKNKAKIPTTIHCDHLIQAKDGSKIDLKKSIKNNEEVYNFLKKASNKYGIGFWNPGSGIIHQIILENYAFPGGMMVGTDSHTPNAGGLGMLAIGIGGADAVELLSGFYLELKIPKIIGVHLKGNLNGWTSPKDIILKLLGMIGVSGATGCIIEYFGKGIKNISCTGKATICNMGAELGATSSIFPYDQSMKDFLYKSRRKKISKISDTINNFLKADNEVYEYPNKYYDQVLTIDLCSLEPYINGPFTPDRAIPISKMKEEIKKNNWPVKIKVGLIGSCTNSSYEDFSKAISILKQAKKKKLKIVSEYLITPGSNIINNFLKKKGFISIFKDFGAKIFSNSCGPCIGKWDRKQNMKKNNTIIHSFNRNFLSRNDGNPNTHAFIASPEIVTALIFSGKLTFNPIKDKLKNEKGEYVKFEKPISENTPFFKNLKLKELGYENDNNKKKRYLSLDIDVHSERLQVLSSFPAWNKKNLLNVRLLIKVKGKCTTDHISMAGKWLKYRGHLEKISDNLLIGAVNYFNNKTNYIKNFLTGNYESVPETAKLYKNNKISSIIVGEENYGEGSSREHAAMEPRFLGVIAVIVKSFSRIHEINLKKQGILAVSFLNKSDYDKIHEDDIFHFYIKDFCPKKNIFVKIIHYNGSSETIIVQHSYNNKQIQWFKYGSFLNFMKKNN